MLQYSNSEEINFPPVFLIIFFLKLDVAKNPKGYGESSEMELEVHLKYFNNTQQKPLFCTPESNSVKAVYLLSSYCIIQC